MLAATEVVAQTQWPLLGATLVGIMAFAPIGLSDDKTGEYCASLFYVILISLLLSWYLAVTVTPFFCVNYLKQSKSSKESKTKDTSKPSRMLSFYQQNLLLALKFRWVTVLSMLALLMLAVFGFTQLPKSFFPYSNIPMFYVDYWRAQGTDIRATVDDARPLADTMRSLQAAFSGKQVGLYRERDELLPIVLRPPANERKDVGALTQVHIWSPLLNVAVPIEQVLDGVTTVWEDQLVRRLDKKRTITVSCDPKTISTQQLFDELKPLLESITLPLGYHMAWGGEYESSHDAQSALAKQLPKGLFLMIIIVIFLFNAWHQPLIIWLTVPLALIGVSAGLFVTRQPFGFMSLLGLLSLSGMLIKNAIVLVDQIDLFMKEGMAPFNAIVEAALGRARPVSLAAITTILGMLPLLQDAFFVSMAVTIMAGLAFATVLTLIVVPVLYALVFRVPRQVK